MCPLHRQKKCGIFPLIEKKTVYCGWVLLSAFSSPEVTIHRPHNEVWNWRIKLHSGRFAGYQGSTFWKQQASIYSGRRSASWSSSPWPTLVSLLIVLLLQLTLPDQIVSFEFWWSYQHRFQQISQLKIIRSARMIKLVQFSCISGISP